MNRTMPTFRLLCLCSACSLSIFFSTEEAGEDANKTLKNHKNKLYFQMKKKWRKKKKRN